MEVVTVETLTALAPTLGSLIGASVGAILAYILGTLCTRKERREEKREIAIAEIFGAMMQFHRDCVTRTRPPHAGSTAWNEQVRRSYSEFLDCFYVRSIWLQKDTYEIVNDYAQEGRKFYNRLDGWLSKDGTLKDDGTMAEDLLNRNLVPAISKAKDSLRAVMGVGRLWNEKDLEGGESS